MRNPYYEALAELRRRIRTASAPDIDGDLATAIGRVAGQGVATHNPALLATGFAFAQRYAEHCGVSGAPFLERLAKKWGDAPSGPLCSACGRAFAPPEQALQWKLIEVEWETATEFIALCGASCAAEVGAAGQPGYASFVTDEALRAFAALRGVVVPASTGRADKCAEKRPS